MCVVYRECRVWSGRAITIYLYIYVCLYRIYMKCVCKCRYIRVPGRSCAHGRVSNAYGRLPGTRWCRLWVSAILGRVVVRRLYCDRDDVCTRSRVRNIIITFTYTIVVRPSIYYIRVYNKILQLIGTYLCIYKS